ncbi:MAG TPA: hypothetical protein VIM27_07920 [Gaiellales bacterium]
MSLSPRQAKRRQMTRTGYAGMGVGAVLLVIALTGAHLILGIIGAIVLVVAGWATRALRTL